MIVSMYVQIKPCIAFSGGGHTLFVSIVFGSRRQKVVTFIVYQPRYIMLPTPK